MPSVIRLFSVIFLEGYVVLATELIAMRQLVPFVGNGIETVAIVIAAVLIPLAIGYYTGGHYQPPKGKAGNDAIYHKLIRNILIAGAILAIGLSYFALEYFFVYMGKAGISHRIAQTTIYCAIFLITPVYLLGQTVPLVSNFFGKERLAEIAGKMLFFSTLGSFMGSLFSTLILMGLIGVNNTVLVTLSMLALAIFLLNNDRFSVHLGAMLAILIGVFAFNNNWIMKKNFIVEDNAYSLIHVKGSRSKPDTRRLYINRSASAMYSPDFSDNFSYQKYVTEQFLEPIAQTDSPKDILVIGAGGFIFGDGDLTNRYTYVDIDPSLQRISEGYLLQRPLDENKTFVPVPARAFLTTSENKYDLVFVDVYSNMLTIPFQLLTEEFFGQLKNHLNDEGILLFNAVTSPNFKTPFSIRFDNGFRKVFPNYTRQVLDSYDGWHVNKNPVSNVIYTYYHATQKTSGHYTDDKNRYYLDRP